MKARYLMAAAAMLGVNAQAQTVIGQSGAVPQVLDQASTTDNIQFLMASAAEHTSNITTNNPNNGRSNFFVQGFTSATDYLAWNVSANQAKTYQLSAVYYSPAGQNFTVSVNGAAALTFTSNGTFDRQVAGTINLAAGTNRIVITRTGTLSGDANFKSVELIENAAVSAYNSRVAAARGDISWLQQSPYGIMFQYGAWGYPKNVGSAKTLDQQAADFDVPTFVNKIVDTGASYVIWSISWWSSHLNAPLTSPNQIVTAAGGPANPGLTSNRDLIGEVATALKAKGIRFGIYYHTGAEDSGWWPYQNYPAGFSATGTGDRSTFFNNWKTVIAEIGNRYGTNLDAFFFDDGNTYYPGPFEAMNAAAKAGNPNRVISYNPNLGDIPSLTEFQEVYFGEGHYGEEQLGSAPIGGNGVFVSGPQRGLMQHGMYQMDANDWGIHLPNQPIIDRGQVWSQNLISAYQTSHSRNVPVSWDIMMYEDGTVNEMDLNNFNNLRQFVYPGSFAPVPTSTSIVDDTSGAITYSGTGWGTVTGRSTEYNSTLHYATTPGNAFSYTFAGTGIDVIGPKTGNAGKFSVTVDGVSIANYSAVVPTYTSQQVIYSARHLSPGNHTISLAMVDGDYFQLDALRVVPNPTTRNDDDAAITYTGSWAYSANRGVGDNGNDVHYTFTNGDSFTTSFTGTGVEVFGPMEPGDGTADVFIDGTQVSTIKATHGGNYAAQQHYWGISALTPGTHTLKIVKTSGQYFQVDKVVITP